MGLLGAGMAGTAANNPGGSPVASLTALANELCVERGYAGWQLPSSVVQVVGQVSAFARRRQIVCCSLLQTYDCDVVVVVVVVVLTRTY